MPLIDLLIPELDFEASFTRKHLERVPMDNLDFRVQAKSMSFGELSTFLAVIPTWGHFALTTDSFDVAPGGTPRPQQQVVTSQRELLEMFDSNIADVRAVLGAATDDFLRKSWSLLAAGITLFTQPRFLVYQMFFLNHMVHHRAQLGVFFRLTGIPVPAVYNDSADEQGGMFMESQPGVGAGSA